jgi:hypothetical protein
MNLPHINLRIRLKDTELTGSAWALVDLYLLQFNVIAVKGSLFCAYLWIIGMLKIGTI